MKTLLHAGIAGVLTMAPGAAAAAVDSASDAAAAASVDLSYAAPTALAQSATATKSISRMGSTHQMGNMSHARGMKRMGNMHQMKGFRHAGSHVRRGRMGYDKAYRKPHRGFRLPKTFIQPSFFIANFGHYGLSQPNSGYGWSRYYDDAVLTDRYGVVQDARYNVDWDRYNQGYHDGYRDGQATYDPGVFVGDDRVVATPPSYGGEYSTYQGDWDGAYREDGSYQGEWQGTYRDAGGRVYQGEYSGTFIGDGYMAPHWGTPTDQGPGCEVDPGYDPRGCSPVDQRYPGYPQVDDRHAEELAYLEHCKKSSGIGGAIIGGAIGAFAGNRIAGRGDRLAGSLIGGGLGAVAGAAIEQGTDRCRHLLKKYGYEGQHAGQYPVRPPVQHHRPHPPQGYPAYPSGWTGYYTPGYYYPQVQPMVTTIVVQSAPVTTTTTTTYVEEEVIYSKPTYKKQWQAAPKKVWKPAPLKGCQQARCMYD